jgi:hypothetical protein
VTTQLELFPVPASTPLAGTKPAAGPTAGLEPAGLVEMVLAGPEPAGPATCGHCAGSGDCLLPACHRCRHAGQAGACVACAGTGRRS